MEAVGEGCSSDVAMGIFTFYLIDDVTGEMFNRSESLFLNISYNSQMFLAAVFHVAKEIDHHFSFLLLTR